ncbi:MAG: membrane protein insertase YidC [Victivallaceae bacterium]|nr:membrane protein insertase YidC [Victivallaceae bacterium]
MKLDKETIVAIAICVLVMFLWNPFCRMMGWLPDEQPASGTNTEAVAAPAPAPENTAPATAAKVQKPRKIVVLENRKLANAKMSLELSSADGSIRSMELLGFRDSTGKDSLKADFGLVSGIPGALAVTGDTWTDGDVVKNEVIANTFLLDRVVSCSDGDFVLSRKMTVDDSGYGINCEITLRNTSQRDIVARNVAIHTGSVPPWTTLSGDKVRQDIHRVTYMEHGDSSDYVAADKKDAKFFISPLVDWCAAGNKYFCAVLDAGQPYKLAQSRTYIKNAEGVESPAISTGLAIGDVALKSGEAKTMAFRFYAGPKDIDSLKAFAPYGGKVMHLSSWGPMDYLARFLLWFLNKLNAIIGSYGASIIVLTLIVRLIFYPITAKSNASMRKMSAVQPKMKELREKYKDNPQLLQAKMMELYKKEGVNPFGGCLPILLQIPVFFALYAMLDGAIELRQVPFLWCHDLAQADTIFRIPLFVGGMSMPFNPLVIAMTVLMVIQQRLTPMSGDPSQKKMMAMMPIIMLIFLYDLPSGLTLYWTVSNICSIAQIKLQQKFQPPQAPAEGGAKN